MLSVTFKNMKADSLTSNSRKLKMNKNNNQYKSLKSWEQGEQAESRKGKNKIKK